MWKQQHFVTASDELAILYLLIRNKIGLQAQILDNAYKAVAHAREAAVISLVVVAAARPVVAVFARIKHPVRADARLRVVDRDAVVHPIELVECRRHDFQFWKQLRQPFAAVRERQILFGFFHCAALLVVPNDQASIPMEQPPPEQAPDPGKVAAGYRS